MASLRAFQEMHNNYFEEFEELAEEYADKHKWKRFPPATREELISTLRKFHGVEARVADFSLYPELSGQRFIFLPGKPPQLLLNDQLNPSQHVYSIVLQIGYSELKIGKHLRTSPWKKFDSFEEVMDNFRASYFAGALMINRFHAEKEIQELFQSKTWDGEAILKLLKHHEVTPETFLHRLSQILPGLFKKKELHFLRFEHMIGKNDIRLTKELNMPRTLVPSGVSLDENYCRRWLPVSLLKEMETEQTKLKPEKIIIRAQRAQFMESGNEVLFISIGRALNLNSKINRCVSLELRIDKALKAKVKFFK